MLEEGPRSGIFEMHRTGERLGTFAGRSSWRKGSMSSGRPVTTSADSTKTQAMTLGLPDSLRETDCGDLPEQEVLRKQTCEKAQA